MVQGKIYPTKMKSSLHVGLGPRLAGGKGLTGKGLTGGGTILGLGCGFGLGTNIGCGPVC